MKPTIRSIRNNALPRHTVPRSCDHDERKPAHADVVRKREKGGGREEGGLRERRKRAGISLQIEDSARRAKYLKVTTASSPRQTTS